MKVLLLPCKWLDLRLARMTTSDGSPVSSRRCKNSVPNKYYYSCAKYSDTQNKVHLKKTLCLTKLCLFQQCKGPFLYYVPGGWGRGFGGGTIF